MKITKDNVFQPITIKLETEEDVEAFSGLLVMAKRDISNAGSRAYGMIHALSSLFHGGS